MNMCIIDMLTDPRELPTREVIEAARAKQLAAIKELRRRLAQRAPLFTVRVHSAA